MNNDTQDGSEGERPTDNDDLSPQTVFSYYQKARASEHQIEQVLARLSEAGLLQANREASEADNDESLEFRQLHQIYQQYRETRGLASKQAVNVVMAALSEETNHQSTSTKPEIEVEHASPSAWHALFRMPGNVLDKALAWFRAGGSTGSLFPRVALPAMALAITAIALMPLIFENPDGKIDSGGARVVAYTPPDGLLNSTVGASKGIDLDPGVVMGLSGNSHAQSKAFTLGRRLLEATVLSNDENTQSTVTRIVGAKLEVAASSIEDAESRTAVSILAAKVSELPADRESLNTHIQHVRDAVNTGELSLVSAWVGFGEATEALAMAIRLYGGLNSSADSTGTALLVETLDSFNAMKFASSVPNLSEQAVSILSELESISSLDSSDVVQVRQLSDLVQQLLLSVT